MFKRQHFGTYIPCSVSIQWPLQYSFKKYRTKTNEQTKQKNPVNKGCKKQVCNLMLSYSEVHHQYLSILSAKVLCLQMSVTFIIIAASYIPPLLADCSSLTHLAPKLKTVCNSSTKQKDSV